MSKNYDNWERLVDAVLRREQFRELARASDVSSCSSSFSSNYSLVEDTFLARESSFDEYIGIASRSERGAAATSGTHQQNWLEIVRSQQNLGIFQFRSAIGRKLLKNLNWRIKLKAENKKGFYLDERSGKKCYMLCARKLGIAWGDDDRYWKWKEYPGSRFSKVAHLKLVWWLDIRGKINTRMLSSNTTYGVYLVFKLDEGCSGLESANAVVRFVDNEEDADAERRAGVVHLQQPGEFPSRRSDGWMEIEMGSFYNDMGDDGEAEGRLMEIRQLNTKCGLIVEGIEFRPMI